MFSSWFLCILNPGFYFISSSRLLTTPTAKLTCRQQRHVCKEKPLAACWQLVQPRPDTFRLTFGPCQLACTVTTLLNTLLQIYPLIVTFEKLLLHFLSSLGIVFKFCKFPISKLELLEISSLFWHAVLRAHESNPSKTTIRNFSSSDTNVLGYLESNRSSTTIFDN